MRPMTVDNNLLEMMISIHSEFQILDESSTHSIIDLLRSEDAEVKATGISILNTFNYFKTPELIKYLYHSANISDNIDKLDQFALMVRLNYANGIKNKLTKEEKIYDQKLVDYAIIYFE